LSRSWRDDDPVAPSDATKRNTARRNEVWISANLATPTDECEPTQTEVVQIKKDADERATTSIGTISESISKQR
jgi:hypothetical protein